MEIREKMEILKFLQPLAMAEGERIWTRSATMLYASTGLLGILSFSLERQDHVMAFGCSALGLLVAICWLCVLRVSRFLYERWQSDIDALIREDEVLSSIVRGRLNPRVARPALPVPSVFLAVLPLGLIIGWTSILSMTIHQIWMK